MTICGELNSNKEINLTNKKKKVKQRDKSEEKKMVG